MTPDQATDRHEVRWNLVLQYSGLGLMVVQGIVLVPLYLRFVGAVEFGLWLVAGGVATWIAIVDPGVSGLFQQRVSRALGSDQPARVRLLVRQGLRLTSILGALMVGAGAIAAPWLLRVVDSRGLMPSATGSWMIFLAVLGVAAGMVASFATSVGVALRNARQHTIVSLVASVLSIITTVALLFADIGVLALAIGVLVRGAVEAGIGYVLVCRELASLPTPSAEVASENGAGFEIGMLKWSSLEKLVGTVAATADLFLVGRCFDGATVTSYAIMRRPVDMLSTLLLRSSGALIPTVTYLDGKQADADLCELIVGACSRIVWLLSVACLGAVVFLEPLVGLWVGPQHYLGAQITAVLVVGLAIQVFAGAFANFLWASGAAQVFLKLNTLLSAMSVIGMIAGIYFGGVVGLLLGALLPKMLLGIWLLPKLALTALRISRAGRMVIWRESAHAMAAFAVGLIVFLALKGTRSTAFLNGLGAIVGAVTALGILSSLARRDLSRAIAWWPRKNPDQR